MTLCVVNAHHRNGRVEKRIYDIQDLSRTSILHAQHMWPDAINTFLWPYAVRYAVFNLNKVKKGDQEQSAVELFSKEILDINLQDFHTFGCPAFVLMNNM
jgi:hypothetical protein